MTVKTKSIKCLKESKNNLPVEPASDLWVRVLTFQRVLRCRRTEESRRERRGRIRRPRKGRGLRGHWCPT